jgi:hypothetical protein
MGFSLQLVRKNNQFCASRKPSCGKAPAHRIPRLRDGASWASVTAVVIADDPMPPTIATRILPAFAGALAVVLPAAGAAQSTGACGQTAALTEALDAPIAAGFGTLRRFVQIRRNEARYLEFTLEDAQDVTIRTEAPGIDPALALYDQSGQAVASDDDSGGGVDAQVSGSFGPGRYCLQVRPIGAEPIDFAELVVIFSEGMVIAPGAEPPCSTPGTRELALGFYPGAAPVRLEDETEPGTGRRDFFLSLAEPMGLGIDLSSADFDTVLEITDAAGASVASNDDFNGTDSRIEQGLPAGDYCVRARSFSEGDGRFSLSLSETEATIPTPPCGDPARTGILASGFGQASAPAQVQGEVPPDLLEGWFSLSLAEATDLRIDARSSSIDTVLTLYDATGGLLDENDDGPEGTDSRLETMLDQGEYCVVVRGYADAAGPFDLSVSPAGMAPPPVAAAALPDPAAAQEIEDMGLLNDVVRSYTIGGEATLWASFALAAPATVTVSGMSVSSDYSVAVFAPDGTSLGEAGPVPAMSPIDLPLDLGPGPYLVALTNHGGSGTLLRQITVTRN